MTAPPAVTVTVVDAPACHLCEDAIEALAALATEYRLVVIRIAGGSAEGRALMARYRAPMSPLVLVDGELFSWGRLPRRKLQRLLDARLPRRVA